LAELGFDVDALDISDVAAETISRHAVARGASVRSWRLDVSEPFPRPPYEVVVTTSFLDRSLFARMIEVLGPGGLLFVETFTRDQGVVPREMGAGLRGVASLVARR